MQLIHSLNPNFESVSILNAWIRYKNINMFNAAYKFVLYVYQLESFMPSNW